MNMLPSLRPANHPAGHRVKHRVKHPAGRRATHRVKHQVNRQANRRRVRSLVSLALANHPPPNHHLIVEEHRANHPAVRHQANQHCPVAKHRVKHRAAHRVGPLVLLVNHLALLSCMIMVLLRHPPPLHLTAES